MIIFTDIHGCFLTFEKLLKKVPDEEIVFLGDLVDRGPHSKQVVEFAMKEKVLCVQGNHDHMAWGAYEGASIQGYLLEDIWQNNGADATHRSYGGRIPNEHLNFLKALPLYLEFPGLLLSHTGNGRDGKDGFEKLWDRALLPARPGEFRIFGHTHGKYPVIERDYANIDTGAAYKNYGTLTAIQWPSLKIWQQEFCD